MLYLCRRVVVQQAEAHNCIIHRPARPHFRQTLRQPLHQPASSSSTLSWEQRHMAPGQPLQQVPCNAGATSTWRCSTADKWETRWGWGNLRCMCAVCTRSASTSCMLPACSMVAQQPPGCSSAAPHGAYMRDLWKVAVQMQTRNMLPVGRTMAHCRHQSYSSVSPLPDGLCRAQRGSLTCRRSSCRGGRQCPAPAAAVPAPERAAPCSRS